MDDAYVHLAYAKNLLQHRIWGVTSHEFTSSSSSPLWIFLLAAASLAAGTSSATPLILNFFCSLLVIVVAEKVLRASALSGLSLAIGLLLFTVLACLIPLSFSGLEHVAQILVSLLFLYESARFLEKPGRFDGYRARVVRCVIFAFLLTALRYEGAWLVSVVGVLCLIRRRFFVAIMLALAGLVPVVAVGVFSHGYGWPFLPASILLKARRPEFTPFGLFEFFTIGSYRQLLDLLPLGSLVIASLALYLLASQRCRFWERTQLMLAICILTALIHAPFSTASWYMRYEGYLVAMSLLSLLAAGGQTYLQAGGRRIWKWLVTPSSRLVAFILLSLFALSPLSNRALLSWVSLPISCRNIYEQQIQMGRFCRQFYAGEGIAANDIGALSYLADPHLLDVWGLGTLEVFQARQATRTHATLWPSISFLHELVVKKHIAAILVYDRVLGRYGDPRSVGWIRVGSWTIQHNKVCAQDEVTFYAPDSSKVRDLANALDNFAPQLPPSIRQERQLQ